MATVREMMMQDAAASIETSYMMAVGDTFEGNLDGSMDSDWVAIELEAGTTYRISLSGRGMGDAMAEDTVLVLRDSKGGMIANNDDINSVGSPDNPANLNSRLMFSPEEDGTYYIDASSYNRIPGSDNSGTYTISVVALDLPADIEGTDANEKINGTDGAESIAGGGGDDTIDAMGGDDEIDGGSGNDLITGGPGADMIKGGADMDTISYEYSPMGVTINLRAGTASGGDAEGDELASDIENVRGSMHDDMLSGSRADNMIWGLDGMDNLYGDKGDDTLSGGMGDDELDGGDGMDTLVGGPGADVLTGGEDDDRASFAGSMMGVTVRLHASQLMGGDAEGDSWGDMTTVTYELPDEDGEMLEFEETVPDIVNLTGSGMADILSGDSRGNMIDGGGGDDKLYGGPGGGDDTLHGGKGDDMLFGGWGSDTLHGGAGDDMLNGGKEGDTAGVDTYYGGAGSDMIYANSDDSIDGWLPAFDADDPANTAPENDPDTTPDESTEAVSDPKAVDTVSFARLEKAVGSATTRWTLETNATNVENLIGTSENDFLGGDSDEPNVIEGGDGADNLTGGADDTIGTDADPDDTVSYRTSDRRVNVDLSGTTDVASGGHAQGDTIAGFENVIGSAHDDILVGDGLANKLTGLAGDDDITGGDGGDTIEGGAGADELDGDNGRAAGQTQVLRAGDTLSYAGSMAGVSANLAANSFSGGDAEGDEVAVQRGDDAEMLDHDNDPETDALDVSTFENLTGSMHNDRLTGDHRTNTIMGGDGDDTISGGGAMDVLMGQKGDDSIKGDAGPDHLVGGPGADRLDGGEMRGERDNMVDAANDGRDNDGDTEVDEADETGMVQATIDWAVYRMAEAGVEVDLSNNTGTGGEAMGDRLIGIELIWGSLHGDT
ncbi:MAG: pre-peptidase C-terminal domain-containing protein, partial [Gammaproteobacteria bacterium]|nr:pre-peptidase C-terminal domain-containing protein [Gammaproteobacteria bacterium]